MNTLQDFIAALTGFLNNIILPLLFTLALLIFIYNAAQYFIFQSASDQGREKAKQLALWSVAAFVFLFSLWAIVNLIIQGIGVGGNGYALCSDYIGNDCPGEGNNIPTDPALPTNNPLSDTTYTTITPPADNGVGTVTFPDANPDYGGFGDMGDGNTAPFPSVRVDSTITDSIKDAYTVSHGSVSSAITPIYTPLLNLQFSDESKIAHAKALQAAGLISSTDLDNINNDINQQRVNAGKAIINPHSVSPQLNSALSTDDIKNMLSRQQSVYSKLQVVERSPISGISQPSPLTPTEIDQHMQQLFGEVDLSNPDQSSRLLYLEDLADMYVYTLPGHTPSTPKYMFLTPDGSIDASVTQIMEYENIERAATNNPLTSNWQ